MATTSVKVNPPPSIPFWRDIRVLAIIGQIVFMVAVIASISWLIINFQTNAERQGLQLGFSFLNVTAGFDISEGIAYDNTDTFGRALWVGMVNTVRVSLFGIFLTTIVGVLVGIARLSNNWLLSKTATVYIEIIRNIPLLVLLYFLYFGVMIQLPSVRDSIQPFDLPIFLNQRGATIPSLTPTAGFPIWLAFIVLAGILVLTLWTIQSRQEEASGRPANKLTNSVIAFVLVAAIGWGVTTSFVSEQAILVPASQNVETFADFEQIYLSKIDEDALLEARLSRGEVSALSTIPNVQDLTQRLEANLAVAEERGDEERAAMFDEQLDILNDAEITVCGVEDSPGQVNAASSLRGYGINVRMQNENTISDASAEYADGDCDLLTGTEAQLAAERAILETPSDHAIIPIAVAPLVLNTPAPAGFNIQGGVGISPEFTALLLGLVLYTGAFAAEIVRAGILSVSRGQSEAAKALGLTEGQRLRLIVLPQALRVIIPPMTSQYLNLAKNSSLAVAIAYPDLVSVGNTVMNQSGFAVQVILIFMVSYLAISLSISAFLNWYNQKVALVER